METLRNYLFRDIVAVKDAPNPIFALLSNVETDHANAQSYFPVQAELEDRFFSLIGSGKKTIEGRLNRGRWKEIFRGDILCFQKKSNTEIKIYCEVTHIYFYETFRDLIFHEGLRHTLPGITSVDEGCAIYSEFYSIEDQIEYGVIALELKVLFS